MPQSVRATMAIDTGSPGRATAIFSWVSGDRERIVPEVVVVMAARLGPGRPPAHRPNAPSGAPFADGAFGRCGPGR